MNEKYSSIQYPSIRFTGRSDDAVECDHKRRSAAFKQADCCYACFMEAQR